MRMTWARNCPCVAFSMPRSRYSIKLRKPVLYTAPLAKLALKSCFGLIVSMVFSLAHWGRRTPGVASLWRGSVNAFCPGVYGQFPGAVASDLVRCKWEYGRKNVCRDAMSQVCPEQNAMSPVNPSTFGLQDDVP